VIDKTAADWPASIAATGLALGAYPVGVKRGFMARSAAVERTLNTLRFFGNSPQGTEPNATGYKGFYYHFLDMNSGRRVWLRSKVLEMVLGRNAFRSSHLGLPAFSVVPKRNAGR
jgi:hypothetical protein